MEQTTGYIIKPINHLFTTLELINQKFIFRCKATYF